MNHLLKEIEQRTGAKLAIKKVTDDYFELEGRLVNLKLGDNKERILSNNSTMLNNILVRVPSGEQQDSFMDFIDFLFEQEHLLRD